MDTRSISTARAIGWMFAAPPFAVLRSRRRPGRKPWLTVVALVGAALGCGSQEVPDASVTPSIETKREAEPQRPARFGEARVEYSDGFATVHCDGSLQLAVLEQLAEQAGFEIVAGRVHARPITLRIERVPLVDAIAAILDGLPYRLQYAPDDASGSRMLARVEIGELRQWAAANAGRGTPKPPEDSASGAAAGAVAPPDDEDAAEQAELLASLASSDPDARIDAIDWIELDPKAMEQMTSLLASDPDAEVRGAIVDRLGDEESPAALAALITALRDPDSDVVLRAIAALETAGGPWLIPDIEPLLSHPDPEVREAAQDAKRYWE